MISLLYHPLGRTVLFTKYYQILKSEMYEAKDNVFMITGGAAGLGAGMTRSFLKEGAKHVAVLDLDVTNGIVLEKELTAIYGQDKIKFYKCDVTTKDLDTVYEDVVKRFSSIDVVINNAGIWNDGPTMYEKEIAVNFTAVVSNSLRAYSLMRKDRGGKGGTIVNISSICGLCLSPCAPIYSATKSGVLQLSRCLGNKLYYSTSGVRFIILCFGVTETNLIQKYEAIDNNYKESIVETLSNHPHQSVESAVAGTVEAFKRGSSGSIWLIANGKPAKDITDNVDRAYEIMSQGVFD